MINGKKIVALCTSRVYEPQTHGYIVRLNERLKMEGFATLIFAINSDIYWEEDRVATEKYIYDLIPYRYIDAVIIMDEKIKSHKIAGKIIKEAKLERKFENTPEYFQEIGDFINGFIDPQGYPDGDILGVTFAVQGIVSEDNEHMTFGTLLNTTDFTRENFAKHFRHKVSLVHDTEAAAIAEDWYVHGSDLNAIYLSLNHNLGSARIIGGKVVHTDNLSSGTIEHMTLYPRGKVCYCGKKGCVDRYVSAEALMEAAGMTVPEFFEAKKAGDKKVLKIWNQYLNDLALVIENARMVIDGCVILGGLLDEYITDDDIDKLKKCIRSISCFPQVEPVIIHSHYGSKATLIGSAITEISVYLQRIGLDL